MSTEAGEGEHHVYKIVVTKDPNAPKLTAGMHYIGVDAVAWFINEESSWFTDRMASGTLQITLSSGLEQYQAALGTFELKGGAKTAPIFEQPVLPDRNFIGGPITLNASLTSIKRDTAIAGLLKSAASASLGIVAGMVQTASATGPAKLLGAAGDELVNGVKKVLSETGEKREPIFDFTGLQFSMQPSALIGDEIFILMHRGASLDEKQLTVKRDGQLLLPFLGKVALDDGAWLLLRLRRSDEYSGARDWYSQARSLRGKIKALVADVESESISKEDAIKQLKPSGTGSSTIFDEFIKLRAIIQNDGVLSEHQAGVFVGDLNAAIAAAKKGISENNSAQFKESQAQLHKALMAGKAYKGPIATAFLDGYANLSEARRGKRIAKNIDASQVFHAVKFMPRTLKLVNKSGSNRA